MKSDRILDLLIQVGLVAIDAN